MFCEECIHYSVCKYYDGTFEGENFWCKFADKRKNYRKAERAKVNEVGDYAQCSACKADYNAFYLTHRNYCPNCGAEWGCKNDG